jgi:hypothetical protein
MRLLAFECDTCREEMARRQLQNRRYLLQVVDAVLHCVRNSAGSTQECDVRGT